MIHPIAVRVRDRGRAEFKKRIIHFDNSHIYDQPRRRLGRVFRVDQHYDKLNMIRLKTSVNEPIYGQFDLDLFEIVKQKYTRDIYEFAQSKHNMYNQDTHETGTYYALANVNVTNILSITQLYIETNDREDEDMPTDPCFSYCDTMDGAIQWSDSKYCFADLRNWVAQHKRDLHNNYTHIIGKFTLSDPDSMKNSLRWLRLAKEYGWLPKDTEWKERVSYGRHPHIEYFIPLPKPFHINRLYFSLSCIRMIREFATTVRVTLDIIDQYNIPFDIAALISYNCARNTYSLHMAWPNNLEPVATAKAIRHFLNKKNVSYSGEYGCTDTIGTAVNWATCTPKLDVTHLRKVLKGA